MKNWKPREVIRFLKKRGFAELKNNRGKGDHCCLLRETKDTRYYTEVDKGRPSFSAREMLSFVKQAGVSRAEWRKGR